MVERSHLALMMRMVVRLGLRKGVRGRAGGTGGWIWVWLTYPMVGGGPVTLTRGGG